jgi:hypothetical protein
VCIEILRFFFSRFVNNFDCRTHCLGDCWGPENGEKCTEEGVNVTLERVSQVSGHMENWAARGRRL